VVGQRNKRMRAFKGNVNQFRSFASFAAYIDLLRNWKVGKGIAKIVNILVDICKKID